MARENYYLLLDIDPDRDTTWAAIEPKFRKAIGVWSSQSATHAVPAKRAEYKELLKTKDDIERVLKDDATRKGEADEARKLIVERKTRAVEELEETVRAMATDGYVTPSQVTQLKSRVASKKLTDADVTAALTRLGVPVKAPVVEQTEMRLDDAIAQRIRDTLAQLNKMRAAETPAQPAHDDLYQFLQLAATASNGALLKTAEAEYEKVRNLPKTGDVGLRQNLLGDCLSIFKTPDGRAKYDATLRGMEVEKLLEFVDLAAADKKLVTVKVMEEVIRRGFKAGVAEDRIKQQVKAHAAKKGYSVEVPPSGTIPANTVRCGHCRELIGPTDTSCRKCGRAAKLACPKCGRLNPSEAVTCGEPKCGFPVGDMSRAEGLLRSANEAFLRDEFDDAVEGLDEILRLDLGGGLGIPYTRGNEAPPLPMDYGRLIQEELGDKGCEIEIEPGRLVAGNAGIMVSKVVYVKSGEGRDFLILDGAMNDLIRPAMYDAHHDIVPVREPAAGVEYQPYDIVGPVCESGDTFAKQRMMPPLTEGDLVAFRSAGAYGAVMSSEYNSRPLIPEVMVNEHQFAVIRPRPSFDEMINRDTLPSWL